MSKQDKFGYATISSNSCSAYSNDWKNATEFSKRLQGKKISIASLEAAAHEADIHIYGRSNDVKVHSFFPDAGKAFLGLNGKPSLIVKWEVPNNDIEELKDLVKKLSKQVAELSAKISK